MKNVIFATAAALMLAGCAETSTLAWTKAEPGQLSKSGNRVLWNLSAVNNGMFLFNCIPLWTGYSTRPNRHDYEILQNCMTVPETRRLLSDKVKQLGADRVEDWEIEETSTGAPGLWIVWMRTVRARGVAVKLKK